jgi:hypothetical protein
MRWCSAVLCWSVILKRNGAWPQSMPVNSTRDRTVRARSLCDWLRSQSVCYLRWYSCTKSVALTIAKTCEECKRPGPWLPSELGAGTHLHPRQARDRPGPWGARSERPLRRFSLINPPGLPCFRCHSAAIGQPFCELTACIGLTVVSWTAEQAGEQRVSARCRADFPKPSTVPNCCPAKC